MSQSQSHPDPADTYLRASFESKGASHLIERGRCMPGSEISPHRYRLLSSCQTSIEQGPLVLWLTTIPMGHGAIAQHTPHPLHGSPAGGLLGAVECRRMTLFTP